MRKKALITDGTNCIGISFARKIASLGKDVILIGLDIISLKKIKREIEESYNVNVDFLIADLTNYNDIKKVFDEVEQIDNIEILVNCAGYSNGKIKKNSYSDKELEDVHANITSYSTITKAVLPKMMERNSGTIIFVSPELAFSPFLRNSVYGASKDFMNVFAEIIYKEVKQTNINIQSLNPGGVKSLFYNHYKKKFRNSTQQIFNMDSHGIVEYSFENLGKNLIVIPGWRNKLLMHFKKLVSNVII